MSGIAKRELSQKERAERTQARVGLASNILGLAAGGAATAGALRKPALYKPALENAGPVTGRLLRGRTLSPRGRRLIRAGAIGGLSLQAANVGGDVVANRVLSRESGVSKRDDRFLRRYRDRISPAAEEGYRYLRSGRNARLGNAAVSSGIAALSGGMGVHALRHGSKGWAAVGGAGALLSAAAASSSAKDAARWSSKMGKIRAKAREREAAGVYGMGRRPEVVKSIEQSIVSKSALMLVTGHGVNIEKRNFDAEADRQRRLGLYAGLGAGGGLVLGDATRRRLNIRSRRTPVGRKVMLTVPGSKKGKAALAALAAGSALGLGGGAAAYRLGVSERNNPWR